MGRVIPILWLVVLSAALPAAGSERFCDGGLCVTLAWPDRSADLRTPAAVQALAARGDLLPDEAEAARILVERRLSLRIRGLELRYLIGKTATSSSAEPRSSRSVIGSTPSIRRSPISTGSSVYASRPIPGARGPGCWSATRRRRRNCGSSPPRRVLPSAMSRWRRTEAGPGSPPPRPPIPTCRMRLCPAPARPGASPSMATCRGMARAGCVCASTRRPGTSGSTGDGQAGAKRTAAICGRWALKSCQSSPPLSLAHSPPVVEPMASCVPVRSMSRAWR